ncbi:MAG TPA: hypothetical protein VIG42_04990 [Solirubrobacteraceae bacterium]|jgi:hypothetical protein
MSGAAITSDAPSTHPPHLRLVDDAHATNGPAQPHRPHTLALDGLPSGEGDAHVLVAGSDTATRSKMREELLDLLPGGTHFAEARETWEVIARAPASSMVVLAGDLGDVSAESVMRLLGRRHPTLPVLAVAEKAPTRSAADVDLAGV